MLQNFNRKSISRKITDPQSWKLQAKLTGEKSKGWSNSREKTNSRLQSKAWAPVSPLSPFKRAGGSAPIMHPRSAIPECKDFEYAMNLAVATRSDNGYGVLHGCSFSNASQALVRRWWSLYARNNSRKRQYLELVQQLHTYYLYGPWVSGREQPFFSAQVYEDRGFAALMAARLFQAWHLLTAALMIKCVTWNTLVTVNHFRYKEPFDLLWFKECIALPCFPSSYGCTQTFSKNIRLLRYFELRELEILRIFYSQNFVFGCSIVLFLLNDWTQSL